MEEFHKAPIKFYPQIAMRNRAKLRAYIGNGIIRKFPANIPALLALIAAVAGAWNMAPALAASFITVPVLVPVFIYAARIVTLLVAALLFVGVLYLIGRPRKAREVERDLAGAFGITLSSPLFYRCPFLVACRPIKGTAAKEFVFWSRWQDLARWNKPEIRQAVLWALNVHSEEDFTPGDKPYTVKIRAASGSIPEEREVPPQDPLF